MKIETNTTPMNTMGERIRALRKSRGISQNTLSDFLSTDKSSISRWENDERFPDPDMIAAIAEKFEVTPYYLMFGHNNDDAANLIDLNGLTFSQIALVKQLVEELRKGC